MLILHGPTYRYSGETLTSPTIVYVRDHHYNEQDQCFHLERLLQGSVEHTVIFDHVVQHDEFLINPLYCPTLLARETIEFDQQQIVPDWSNKTHAFNFSINKPRIHRLMLLKLIGELNLNNYCHSLCWKNSPVKSIATTDYRLGNEFVMDQGFKSGHYRNSQNYQGLLQTTVFEPSYASLITEPSYYERETIITEKTIMAVYGGTIPIWVGGWRIADYMRNLGFDVFDDLVDHSYQCLPDPAERCRRAVIDNLDVLEKCTPVDHTRLQHNLDLLKSNPWLSQVNSLIKIYPDLRKVWPA